MLTRIGTRLYSAATKRMYSRLFTLSTFSVWCCDKHSASVTYTLRLQRTTPKAVLR